MAATFDRRLHAYRDDLADMALKGRVNSQRFVAAKPYHVAAAIAPVHPSPSHEADLDTQALGGEAIDVFEIGDAWAWGQLRGDGYVGYLPAAALALGAPVDATHKVSSPHAFAYTEPTARSRPVKSMLFGTTFQVRADLPEFLELSSGGFIGASHAEPVDAIATDYVATMQAFLGTPYLWGGKSALGVDCSGLVQLALLKAGIRCPRDTDMQARDLPGGVDISATSTEATAGALQRGDIVYWPRHVGVMVDDAMLIHANGGRMATTIDPFVEVAARADADGRPISAIKRLMPTARTQACCA